MRSMLRARAVAAPAVGLFASVLVLAAPPASSAAIPPYTLVGSFPLSASAWDVLPDGRVVTINGSSIAAQTGPNASTYAPLGSVPAGTVSSFGASFLRASPDGTRLAIGDNNFGASARVHFVGIASLNTGGPTATTSLRVGNYDAAWADGSTLYVSGFGSASQVYKVDADALTARTVITDIGDGSGGVALTASRVYTGVGYDAAGATTGQIRGFDRAALDSAPAATAFNTGAYAATILSGASLGFDRFGNLLGAGADFSLFPAVTGYAAVVDLVGGDRLELAPAGTGRSYRVRFNAATDELLVVTGGTAYRYAVPAPAALAPLALSGVLACRRRRHG